MDPEATLPAASVAVQFTVVSPRAKVLPDFGSQTGVMAPSTASLAEESKLTAAPSGPVASLMIESARTRTGFVVSLMMTLTPAVALLPAPSVAVHDTRVVPTGNEEPDAGVQ